ncbi:MAG: AMIN domain-containing protein [candidate division WOR-3 bacterium]|nr:AMIN domain-containing protein [candidate division WOR-3 bacterium]
MNKKIFIVLFSIFLLFIGKLCFGQTTEAQQELTLKSINYELLLDKVRVTLVCNATPSVSHFTLDEPERIVIDLFNTKPTSDIQDQAVNIFPVRKISVTQWQGTSTITRITIELDNKAEYNLLREKNMVVVDVDVKKQRIVEQPIVDTEKKVSMYVKDADIVDLLRMIGTQFNINIVVSPDVKSSITVRLDSVPVMSAIDALVKAAGCNYVMYESGIMLVKPKGRPVPGEFDSRIFELDYAEATDIKDVLKLVLSDRGTSELIFRRVADGGGSKRTAAILVTDYPEYLEKAAAVIAQLDQPSTQIAIEAKFIETTMSTDNMYGIDWSLRTAVTPEVPRPGEMAMPVRFYELVIGKLSLSQLSLALEIMQSEGKSRLIANPRTITLDNQTAEINMGISVPVRSLRVDPETRERFYVWSERFIPIGLKVTPHATSDGMINMTIEPKVEAIIGYEGTPEDRRPIITRREAKTQVMVKDGEVVVLGGLIKDEESKVRSKVPILGDIPILGKLLFSRTQITKQKSELIIFIIPQIVKT